MSSERERIDRLRAALAPAAAPPGVRVGIGDDAAVLSPGPDPLVWTVDAAVDGVHFRRDLLTLDDVGYRATMAAASDLAAMGARPLGVLSALVLPAWASDEDLDAIARGQRAAADALGTAIVGGNLSRGGELSITTTVLGAAARPILRSGARPGDAIWIAGPVGLAAAGLAILARGIGADEEIARAAIAAWRRPWARIAEGLRAASVATAAIDVSDGLAQDVGHVARASGVTAILDADALADPTLAAIAAAIGRDAIDLALRGGEDYALVVTAPPERAMEEMEGFARIGVCVPQMDAAVALRLAGSAITPLDERGFDHF